MPASSVLDKAFNWKGLLVAILAAVAAGFGAHAVIQANKATELAQETAKQAQQSAERITAIDANAGFDAFTFPYDRAGDCALMMFNPHERCRVYKTMKVGNRLKVNQQ